MKSSALTAVAVLLVAGSTAVAQFRPGGAGPQGYPGGPVMNGGVSPYLNLVGGGRNPAVNYYGLVRPQFAMQNAIAGLQQQQAMEQQNDPTDPTLNRGTGHAVFFNNLSHYYYNDPSQPAGARFGASRGGAATGGATAGATRGAGTGRTAMSGAGAQGTGVSNRP